ncbi:MAG: (4Fe-4S)-binding protein [Chthonomonas sp.]|nr:(4Fe-4S)-binding protein [Chthonomonas sp.]
MSTHEIRRDYSYGDVTVHWDASKCIHCGHCAQTLPAVFKPRERPWIRPENASREEVIATVLACPSGAISIKE